MDLKDPKNTIILTLKVFLCSLFLLNTNACFDTQNTSNTTTSTATNAESTINATDTISGAKLLLEKGKRPFSFSPSEVSTIWFTKQDPTQNDFWSASFKKIKSDLSIKEFPWIITSPPNGESYSDNYANDNYLNHLLDTLRTLQIIEKAPLYGPLKTFGLEPPIIAIRWKVGHNVFEIYLGEKLKNNEGRYAYFPGADNNTVWIVKGATLGLLDHLEGFYTLRHNSLFFISLDDIDEFEIYKGGSSWFYAQRLSGTWANKKNKAFKEDPNPWLEYLLHIKIKSFFDNGKKVKSLLKKIKKDPTYTIIFKNREKETSKLLLIPYSFNNSQQLLAHTSNRFEGIFEVDMKLIRHIESIKSINLQQ